MSATSESSVSPTPPKRERLLSRWHLVFVAMVGLLALAMVAPSSRMLENTSVRPDRLSLQYLRLMTAMRPNDMGLKLHLARVLLALNQLDEANKLVDAARATTDPQLRLWAWRLGLQIHIAQFTGDPSRATRDPQLARLRRAHAAVLAVDAGRARQRRRRGAVDEGRRVVGVDQLDAVASQQGGDPQRAEQAGLIGLLEKHGVMILVGELAVLGVLTMGAILTDDFWTRRFEAQANQNSREESSL